jgi:hypothetical protein
MYSIHISCLERVQCRFLKNEIHMLTGNYPPRGYPNDLHLGQFGMSSVLSRHAKHSVVFLFKLIQGLDCSDLLSQVTFKINRPACRTKNTFFLPTRHNQTGLKIYIKKLIINKKCCKEKLVLKRRLVCKKKEENCINRGCRCKNVDAYETNAHYRRILVTPLRTNAGVIFDVYLSNLTNTS